MKYYELENETQNEILTLKRTCETLKLGNVSFEYYPTTLTNGVIFYIQEFKNHWGLSVRSAKGLDVYRIENNEIKYQHSEE